MSPPPSEVFSCAGVDLRETPCQILRRLDAPRAGMRSMILEGGVVSVMLNRLYVGCGNSPDLPYLNEAHWQRTTWM